MTEASKKDLLAQIETTLSVVDINISESRLLGIGALALLSDMTKLRAGFPKDHAYHITPREKQIVARAIARALKAVSPAPSA